MDQEILRKVVSEHGKEFEKKRDYVERELLKKVEPLASIPSILVISGIRRSGKSTLLKQIRERFYGDKPCYYLNFEDERLTNFSLDDFNPLFETFLQLYGKGGTFFFDEIQNVEGWERFARRMHDWGSKLIITGSNSSMLSRELGSKLTGRYVNLELFPFSFKEFLQYKKQQIPKDLLTEDRARIKKSFSEYTEHGGMPEYLIYQNTEMLKNTYESIVYRDILVRYKITDEKPLKDLALYIYSNYATEISPTNLKNMLGLGSLNTVKKYLHYMENTYLIYLVPRHEYSLKKQAYSTKKVYVADNGLIKLLSVRPGENRGRLMENTVCIELLRRGNKAFYHKEKHECDFVSTENNKITSAIQVTENLTANKDREYAGLLEAMEKYKLKEGTIITSDEERTEKNGKNNIKITPLWKWLLDTGK